MIKRISLLITAALMGAMMMVATAAPAFASPASDACQTQGGDYQKTGPGQFTCVLPPQDTNPGNPTSDNAATPKHVQKSDTQTGSGGGGGEASSSLTCVYNNGGKLQASQSDSGCPPTQ